MPVCISGIYVGREGGLYTLTFPHSSSSLDLSRDILLTCTSIILWYFGLKATWTFLTCSCCPSGQTVHIKKNDIPNNKISTLKNDIPKPWIWSRTCMISLCISQLAYAIALTHVHLVCLGSPPPFRLYLIKWSRDMYVLPCT